MHIHFDMILGFESRLKTYGDKNTFLFRNILVSVFDFFPNCLVSTFPIFVDLIQLV